MQHHVFTLTDFDQTGDRIISQTTTVGKTITMYVAADSIFMVSSVLKF